MIKHSGSCTTSSLCSLTQKGSALSLFKTDFAKRATIYTRLLLVLFIKCPFLNISFLCMKLFAFNLLYTVYLLLHTQASLCLHCSCLRSPGHIERKMILWPNRCGLVKSWPHCTISFLHFNVVELWPHFK